MSSSTYAGTLLAAVAAVPTTNDQAGMEALTFEAGDCALHAVPGIGREWSKVMEPLVCRKTNVEKKGSSKWKPMVMKLSRRPGDALQAVLRGLEDDEDGIGTFRITLPNGHGTAYVQAMVSTFDYFDGGSQDDWIAAPLELLIQQEPVFVDAA